MLIGQMCLRREEGSKYRKKILCPGMVQISVNHHYVLEYGTMAKLAFAFD